MAKEKTRTVMCRIDTICLCCWERFPCGRFCPKRVFLLLRFFLSLRVYVVFCNVDVLCGSVCNGVGAACTMNWNQIGG